MANRSTRRAELKWLAEGPARGHFDPVFVASVILEQLDYEGALVLLLGCDKRPHEEEHFERGCRTGQKPQGEFQAKSLDLGPRAGNAFRISQLHPEHFLKVFRQASFRGHRTQDLRPEKAPRPNRGRPRRAFVHKPHLSPNRLTLLASIARRKLARPGGFEPPTF